MKKFKLETKYLMITLVIVIGLLLAVSGTFQESKSMTAYKTDATGSDSARVAKWDVVGVTRNNGVDMDLSLGFSKEVKEAGDWYFEIENKSEVLAKISNASTIKFRLLHDSFADFEDSTITWNFLKDSNGNKRVNEIDFEIYAYNASASEMLTYKHKTTNDVITYSAYAALTVQEKAKYTEIFTIPSGTEQILISLKDNAATSSPLSFEKKSEVIEGATVYFYEATFNLTSILAANANLGLGASKQNTTFRVHWEVPVQCTTHADSNSDDKCDVCGELISSNDGYSYYKYIIAETADPIEGYTIMKNGSGNTLTYKEKISETETVNRYIFRSNDKLDFYSYQKYTSTLGGQPMFEMQNDTGTQTILVPYDTLINDEQMKAKVEAYSTADGANARSAWEKLTYDEYAKFSVDYVTLQDSLSYMSYGVKLQIIFNLTVEQVD